MKKILIFTIALTVLTNYTNAAGIQTNHEGNVKLRFQESPFESCKNIALLDQNDYQLNTTYWDNAIKQCGDEVNIQVLSKTGFGIVMSDEVKSLAFLQEVGNKALKYVDKSIDKLSQIAECFSATTSVKIPKEVIDKIKSQKTSPQDCQELMSDYRELIKEEQPKARLALALSNGDDHIDATGGPNKNTISLNYFTPKLSSFSESLWQRLKRQVDLGNTLVPRDIENLTADEIKAADGDKEMAAIRQTLENEGVKKQSNTHSFALDIKRAKALMTELEKIRANNKMRYFESIQKAPVLAYLGKTNPSDTDIAKANYELLKNAINEKERMEKTIKEGSVQHIIRSANGRTADISAKQNATDLLPFIAYKPIVEAMTKKDPQLCSTATSLAYHAENKDTRKMVALGGGFLIAGGAAGLAAPALGIGAGAIANGLMFAMGPTLTWAYFVPQGSEKIRHIKEGALAHSGLEKHEEGEASNLHDLKEIDEAQSEQMMNIIAAPLDFMGGGAVSQAGKRALAMSLIKSKIGEEEAIKLAQLAKSNDKEVAQKANQQINKAINDSVRNLFGVKPTKGTLEAAGQVAEKFGDEQYVKSFAAAVSKLAQKDQEIFVENVTKIAESLNKDKMNAYTKEDILETMLAAAKLGVHDPKLVAKNLTEWPLESLVGLRNTYERAAKIAESEKGKSIGELKQKDQEKYIRASLRQEFEENPEIKTKSADEKAALEKQMCECAAACAL